MFESIMSMDLVDLNHIYTLEERGMLKEGHALYKPPAGLGQAAKSMFGLAWSRLAREIVRKNLSKEAAPWFRQKQVDAVFVVGTKNQYDALRDIRQAAKLESVLVSYGSPNYLHEPHISFPSTLATVLSVPFIPKVFWDRRRSKGYARLAYDAVGKYFLDAYGYFMLWYWFFQRVRPRCVVLANDHHPRYRVVQQAAQALSIPTVYVQHASVNTLFPPLTFDYALLDGEDALSKYNQIGASSTEVFLVGMAKSDRFVMRDEQGGSPLRVGVCANDLDTVEGTRTLCEHLAREVPGVSFIFRPHPRTVGSRLQKLEQLVVDIGFGYSDSKTEGVDTFLQRVDVLIAGETAIHLEAVLSNIETIYYTHELAPVDHYDYLAQGLVERSATKPEEVVLHLRSLIELGQRQVRHRAKYYVDTVGTEWDGRSAELAAMVLDDLIVHGKPVSAEWEPVSGSRIHAQHLSSTVVS